MDDYAKRCVEFFLQKRENSLQRQRWWRYATTNLCLVENWDMAVWSWTGQLWVVVSRSINVWWWFVLYYTLLLATAQSIVTW